MKLILLQHLSGEKVYNVGDEMEVTDAEAVRLIAKGIAKAKNIKAHNDLMAKAEEIEKAEELKRQKIVAIQRAEELRESADDLIKELVPIISALESIDSGYREAVLEKIVSSTGKIADKDIAG